MSSYSATSTSTFPDGSRVETTVTYHPPPPAPPRPVPVVARLAGVHDSRSLATVKKVFPGTRLTRPFISGVQSGPRPLTPAVAAACGPSWAAGLVPT